MSSVQIKLTGFDLSKRIIDYQSPFSLCVVNMNDLQQQANLLEDIQSCHENIDLVYPKNTKELNDLLEKFSHINNRSKTEKHPMIILGNYQAYSKAIIRNLIDNNRCYHISVLMFVSHLCLMPCYIMSAFQLVMVLPDIMHCFRDFKYLKDMVMVSSNLYMADKNIIDQLSQACKKNNSLLVFSYEFNNWMIYFYKQK